MKNKEKKLIRWNLGLLATIFTYVFILGIIPLGKATGFVYSLVFSFIYMFAARIESAKGENRMYIFAGATILVLWFSELFYMNLLAVTSAFLSIIFLLYAIIKMLGRIALSKKASALEFIEAINIYFLMGIIGSILFRMVYQALPGESYNVPGDAALGYVDFIYFSFVTLSTLGYGDITPIDSFAKTLSIFLSISGQLYLTMIIALLIGKYLNAKSGSHSEKK